MKLYRAKYKDRKGKVKTCSTYHLTFIDRCGIRRRMQAYTNKAESESLGREIERVMANNGNLGTDDDRKRFANLLPRIQTKLLEWGVVDGRSTIDHLIKPLAEHLKDFCNGLAADKRKDTYIKQTRTNIERILSNCGFEVWSDIDGNKVKTFLAKSRGKDGYGERTYNAYLRGFKEFCSWMLREDRATGTDPMKSHSLIKQTEYRKKRRALTIDETERLLEATKAAPKRYNMTGYERSLVYRLALETGLRAGEIKSLSVLSFGFKAEYKTVHIEPSDTKGKRPADLILMNDTAETIREFLSGKEPTDKAFQMPHTDNTAVMLRADLRDAGIEYTDANGRDCDFHSLRHTFITNLALAGVHPAVAQKLARHSSIELTMKYYTHVLHTSEVEAIDALKNLHTKQSTERTRRMA